jgi:hypothetical protein
MVVSGRFKCRKTGVVAFERHRLPALIVSAHNGPPLRVRPGREGAAGGGVSVREDRAVLSSRPSEHSSTLKLIEAVFRLPTLATQNHLFDGISDLLDLFSF